MFQALFLPLFYLLLAQCASAPQETCTDSQPLVLVSVCPYLPLVQQIAGSDLAVKAVAPSLSNPHSFEPTAKEMQGIADTVLWFTIGEPFEEKMVPLLQAGNDQLLIQDLREGISLIGSSSHCCNNTLGDRHIWFSPKLVCKQAEKIERALSQKFPQKEGQFKAHLAQLQKDLVKLDQEIETILSSVSKRSLLVSHPAFSYFCKEYGLQQISIEQDGKDPRPKDLEAILHTAMNQNIQLIIILPQHNNKGALFIAEALKIPVASINPYSSNYFEMMIHLANTIAGAYDH